MTALSFEEFEVLASGVEPGRGRPAGASAELARARLRERGLIDGGGVTAAGVRALEPYRVRRAIVLAAGRGERMLPATRAVPKPMVEVGGVPLVHFALKALIKAGITEIHVVRGYLADRLDPLREVYPPLRFIDNPRFDETNNITSLMAARHLLGGSYVMDADLVIRNAGLISAYQYRSNYLAIPTDRPRGWCFSTDRAGRITGAGTQVSEGVHEIVGISYWTPEDGRRLAGDLPRVMAMPGGETRYWDTAAIQYFPERYRVYVRPCRADDVVELDTYEELTRFRAELAAKGATLVA